MNEIKLYLIRHGKTYCNEKQLYCGKSDIELCEAGTSELNENVKRAKYPKCDYYFTSGAKRANQTIEILCPGNKYEILEEFFEYDFGDFELKSYEELKSLREYIDWINDKNGEIKCPSGESRAEFRKRIKEGFEKLIEYLRKENINTALGVTHGGSIGILLEMLYNGNITFYEWQPKNGEGYELIIKLKENKQFKIVKVSKVK